MAITEEQTWSPNDPHYGGPDTHMQINRAEINAGTDVGDYGRSARWDGAWRQEGAIKISTNVSFSSKLWNSPISLSASGQYQSATEKAPAGFENYTNPDSAGQYVREHGIAYPKEAILDSASKGHKVMLAFGLGHYREPGEKQLRMNYRYYLSNTRSYTYGGYKSVTGAVQYRNRQQGGDPLP